jgi:hypothetical protein
MAYQNYEETKQPAEVTQNNYSYQSKNSASKTRYVLIGVLSIGILGLLAGGVAYFGSGWKKEKEASQAKDNIIQGKNDTINTMISDKNRIQAQFEAISAKLDSMSGINSSMAVQIADKDGEIASLKNEIRSLISKSNSGSISMNENKRLQLAIQELQNKTNNLELELSRLREENLALLNTNKEVTSQRDSAQQQNITLNNEKQQLSQTVDIGSTLFASGFEMEGINIKRGGKEASTSTASKIDKLKITFNIGENRITPSGTKELYLIIKDPTGTPIAVEALGSGRFTTREGESKIFTKKVMVEYVQGQAKKVETWWEQQADYKKGDYVFEIYQNGFKIGEGKKTLEKKKVLGIF